LAEQHHLEAPLTVVQVEALKMMLPLVRELLGKVTTVALEVVALKEAVAVVEQGLQEQLALVQVTAAMALHHQSLAHQ
jgi:intracellular sulfur oxidation DsrE/DsrF family protein